ncbi:unnamed protein product [marine sediment metagenome]|uniref:Uncharacterized protein n=1 Tax=marine sediment metagenome TaxID=412755 RepID=X1C4V1_9ZZZZ
MIEKIIKWIFVIFLATTIPVIAFITLNDCFLFKGETIDTVAWLIISFVFFLVFEFSLFGYFKHKDKGSGCALQTLIILIAIIFLFKYFFWQARGIFTVIGIITLLCFPFWYLNYLTKNEEKNNNNNQGY